jgi:hypothetical protein
LCNKPERADLREMVEMSERRASDGYYEAMENWLRTEALN